MYSQFEMIGYVGRVYELKRVGDKETPVIDFTVAANERVGGEEVTTWVKVTAWNGLAHVIDEHVTAGQLVLVKGRAQVEQWTDGDGQPRAGLKVTARDFRMLGRKAEAEEDLAF